MLRGGKFAQGDGAALADRHGNAVRAACGGRSRAFRVGENVGVREGIFRKCAAGFGKFFVRFAGKPDHDVGPDANVRHATVDFANKIQIFRERVVAAHIVQNAVAAALERQVQKRRERVRGIAHAVKNAVGNRFRLDTSDADAVDSGNGGNGVDHAENVFPGIVVGADINSGERDFAHAPRGERFRFRKQVGEVAGTRSAACKRDNAVAAHEVAAVLDFQIRTLCKRRRAGGRNRKFRSRHFPANNFRMCPFFSVPDKIEHVEFVPISDD